MFATRVAVSAETTKQDAKGHGGGSAQARDTKKDERIIKLIMDATEKNILFADLTREQKRAVAGEMWKVNCPKGHKIIEQGKINDDVFYVVDSGTSDALMHAALLPVCSPVPGPVRCGAQANSTFRSTDSAWRSAAAASASANWRCCTTSRVLPP